MPATYEPIATATGTGSANQITFSSIPSTYTDLVLVLNGRMTGAVTYSYCLITVNNDSSGTSYSRTYARGDGSSTASGRDTNFAQLYAFDYVPGASASADVHSTSISHIMNYANTTTYKTILNRDNAAAYGTGMNVGLWRSTSAITTVTLSAFTGNWTTSTTATLYGIKAA